MKIVIPKYAVWMANVIIYKIYSDILAFILRFFISIYENALDMELGISYESLATFALFFTLITLFKKKDFYLYRKK